MSRSTAPAASLRPALCVLLGCLVGAVVAGPTVAAVRGPGSQLATTQTRSASCSGLDFHPIDSATGYGYFPGSTEIYLTDLEGSDFLVCDPNLPQGAVVQKVQFTVMDSDAGVARYCGLDRSGLAASTASTVEQIALVPDSDSHAAGGVARLSSSSISHATVDNTNHAYWLQCQLTDNTHWLGIYGADVIFTISSTNG